VKSGRFIDDLSELNQSTAFMVLLGREKSKSLAASAISESWLFSEGIREGPQGATRGTRDNRRKKSFASKKHKKTSEKDCLPAFRRE
jgi:hypothetical protein